MASSKSARAKPRSSLTIRRRLATFAALCGFVVLAFALQRAESSSPVVSAAGQLRVWVFDVGQGDAIFLEMPTGEQVLVDGGPDDAVLTKLGEVMLPADRTIDALVLTHPHADHLAGLVEVLERYRIGTVYETGQATGDALLDTFRSEATDQGSARSIVKDKENIVFGDVTLTVVAPNERLEGRELDEANDGSVVILVSYGETSLLLTGDAPTTEEADILADLPGSVDVLKVAHHGSATSTSGAFLRAAAPRFAIIPVGENGYGHPHPVLIDRLAAEGAGVFRTDRDGDILITSDGGEPAVVAAPLPF